MTRLAAYIVLIFAAFIIASTTPLWQVRIDVEQDAVNMLIDELSGAGAQPPGSPVPVLWGRRIYDRACSSCHGSGRMDLGISTGFVRTPVDTYSPADIHSLITRGNTGRIRITASHPTYPSILTGTERWAVATWVVSGSIDPGDITEYREWTSKWRDNLESTFSDASGKGLYDTICIDCHGPDGQGNGILAGDLAPAPRVLADTEWLANQSNEYLFMTIRDGKLLQDETTGEFIQTGMPGWGTILDEISIRKIVQYLRSYGYSLEILAMRPDLENPDEADETESYNVVPDYSEWSWDEVRSLLLDAPAEAPDWIN